MHVRKKLLPALALALALTATPLAAQTEAPATAPPAVDAKDALHLNTIGAFSAGFVIQSYGYIGVLADAMSRGVYEPDLVRSMLSETNSYLRNVNAQLRKYQDASAIAAGDKKFIANMMEIISQLMGEADALSSFAQSKGKDDLARYEDARQKAWRNIKKTFGMS